MKCSAIVIGCVLLAACNAPPSRDREDRPVANAQGYLAKVTTLPDGQLRGVLYRAIVDGNATCPQVTSAKREADQNGRAVWSATCKDGARWLVVIGDDGIAQAHPTTKAE